MMIEDKNFKEAIETKKVPILVLDQKWHRLFALSGKSEEILKIESALNELIQHQGQINNDMKELKKIKNTLMGNIVMNMEGAHDENINTMVSKKLGEDRRLIDEINEKIENYEDELLELPKLIKAQNEELMLESMNYCYEKMRINTTEVDEIAAWIAQVRKDLKKNIIKKQNREINSKQIYSYMHDIFGVQVIDLFDLKYEDVETKYEAKAKKVDKE